MLVQIIQTCINFDKYNYLFQFVFDEISYFDANTVNYKVQGVQI